VIVQGALGAFIIKDHPEIGLGHRQHRGVPPHFIIKRKRVATPLFGIENHAADL
jgi:hypothetical protein